MVVYQIPFLLKELQQTLQKEEPIIFRKSWKELSNSGVETMLVDGFVEVPESIEKWFDDVVEKWRLLDGGAEEWLYFGEEGVHIVGVCMVC